MRRFLFIAGLVALIGGAAFFLRSNPSPRARNLLLITVDALRADHLGCYGYPLRQENIGRLANDGLVFENAFTTLPTTQPAISSLLTSLYPRSHTVRKNGIPLPDSALTLAEILKQNGWKTAAFVSAFPLDKRFGIAQGFEEYKDSIGMTGSQKGLKFETDAERMTRAAVKWLSKNPVDRPLFLWIHYFDPHAPYNPPPPYEELKSPLPNRTTELDSYDGEIAYLDSQLGLLLEELNRKGLLRDTLTVLTGDHGEGFGEHGLSGHGWFLYDEVIRVPLIIHGPGITPGRSSVLTQHVDVMPGILEYFSLPLPAVNSGVSWWSVHQKKTPPRDSVWVERRLPPVADPDRPGAEAEESVEEKWTIRTKTEKLIWSSDGKMEFYDLSADPFETQNLHAESDPRAQKLLKLGLELRSKYAKLALAAAPDMQTSDEETREALKALGYVN